MAFLSFQISNLEHVLLVPHPYCLVPYNSTLATLTFTHQHLISLPQGSLWLQDSILPTCAASQSARKLKPPVQWSSTPDLPQLGVDG